MWKTSTALILQTAALSRRATPRSLTGATRRLQRLTSLPFGNGRYLTSSSAASAATWDKGCTGIFGDDGRLARLCIVIASSAMLTMTMMISPALQRSHCEEKKAETTLDTSSSLEDDDTDTGKHAPSYPVYDNVPESDEPTDCFLCRTHRQGPCAAQWRSFEYCAKDYHDKGGPVGVSDAAAAQHCAPFATPFYQCWMQHLNLYLLIAMTINQELVDEVEQQYATDKRKTTTADLVVTDDLPAHIDWSEWTKIFQEDNLSEQLSQQVNTMWDRYSSSESIKHPSAENVPLWKVYDSLGEEPFLVNVTCQIHTHREDGRSLRMVYAVDQDHRTIGLANYHEEYEIEKAQQEGRSPNLEYCRMAISIIPGLTESVKLKALYAGVNHEEDDDEGVATEDLDYADDRRSETIEDILVESPWIATPRSTLNLHQSLT